MKTLSKKIILALGLISSISINGEVIKVPECVKAQSNEQCAQFILTAAGYPEKASSSLEAQLKAIKSLSHGEQLLAVLAIVDNFLNPDKSHPDNKAKLPWAGHLDRLSYFFDNTCLPIDSDVSCKAVKIIQKYRGINNLLQLSNPNRPTTEFETDMKDLGSAIAPQVIRSAITLLPECTDSVCDAGTISKVQAILEKYKNTNNTEELGSLLDELEPYLPVILSNPIIGGQVKRIKTILKADASGKRPILEKRVIKLCVLNKVWLKKAGITK